MKGGGLASALAGATGFNLGAATKSVLSSVSKTVLDPANPLGAAVAQASTLKTGLTDAVDAVKKAPDAIAKAAAEVVDEKIATKLEDAGLAAPPPTIPEATGAGETPGTPTTNDPGSTTNNAVTSGGGYETVYLTKPVKDPLHVFYLNGRAIYFTDNGKGRVKIIPLHSDMQMAKTSSRHKYSKKIKHARKHKSTKKHTVRGVRKTSRKAKQHHSRRRR